MSFDFRAQVKVDANQMRDGAGRNRRSDSGVAVERQRYFSFHTKKALGKGRRSLIGNLLCYSCALLSYGGRHGQ